MGKSEERDSHPDKKLGTAVGDWASILAGGDRPIPRSLWPSPETGSGSARDLVLKQKGRER